MKRVQHEKCATWEKCNTKCPQHEKSAQKVQMNAQSCNMKTVQHEKRCDMERGQHENSTTRKKCNMK